MNNSNQLIDNIYQTFIVFFLVEINFCKVTIFFLKFFSGMIFKFNNW